MAAVAIRQKHIVAAPRSAVTAGIVDPEVLRASIPKCRDARAISKNKIWVQAEVGFQRWFFVLESILTVTPTPTGFEVSGDVRSPHLRLGAVTSSVVLEERDGATVVTSATTLTPARRHSIVAIKIGQKLAKTLTNAFFVNFAAAIAAARPAKAATG